MRNSKCIVAIAASAAIVSVVRAQHAGDIQVGQSAGRLALSSEGFNLGSAYVALERVETFLLGWSGDEPGFEHVEEASGGVAPLSNPVQVSLEVVDLDPALYVLGPSLSFVLDSPGDRGFLGDAELHSHVTWFVDETDPGFDSDQCVWVGRFRLVDTGAGLLPSETFTLLLSIAPVRGGAFPPVVTPASGDWDGDRRVEEDDIEPLSVCVNGPTRRTEPDDPSVTTCEVDCHNAFDFDDDLDVDLLDLAEFMVRWDE